MDQSIAIVGALLLSVLIWWAAGKETVVKMLVTRWREPVIIRLFLRTLAIALVVIALLGLLSLLVTIAYG